MTPREPIGKVKLASRLGVTLPAPYEINGHEVPFTPAVPIAGTTAACVPEAVDLADYPRVQAARDLDTGDRSADLMRVVRVCYAHMLTLGQTRTVVSSRANLAEKLAELKHDDVGRCWQKIDDEQRKRAQLNFWGTGPAPTDGQPTSEDPRGDAGGDKGDGADGQTTPAYADRLLTRSALRDLPDPAPLIDNVLDQGTCALLYGYRGTLKTFIALDWGLCGATGRSWQGRQTEQSRVLCVAAEGAFGSKARVGAWETGWQISVSDDNFSLLPRPVNLTQAPDVANLGALISWGGFSLVIIDTLARCMVGADENSAKDIGIVVDRLYWLLDKTPGRRGVVLGVHHTGKDARTLRGSSAFEAGVDTVYSVTRDGGMVTLNREKRKDGPEPDRHELRLDLIEGSGSGVISAGNLSTGGVDKSDRADRLLSTFVHHFMSTGATKAELRLVADMPPATFHRALSDLLKRGDLINTGTDKRPFYMKGGK